MGLSVRLARESGRITGVRAALASIRPSARPRRSRSAPSRGQRCVPPPLHVHGSADDVFYNKEKITIAQLPLKLSTYKAGAKDPRVVVNSDGDAEFDRVVAVLDEVRRAGIGKVGINTEKK